MIISRSSVSLLAALLGLIGIGAAVIHAMPRNVEIVRTESGFIPSQVYLNEGDRVIFTNASPAPMWPASNAHPSHGLYPEFDPLIPVAPGDSWTFTFTNAGVWKFHDHLTPSLTGTIFVQGERGEAAAACLEKSTDTIRAYCWEPEIRSVITRKGLDRGFDWFAKTYAQDPQFVRNCHDIGHILGVAAYDEYAQHNTVIDRIETSYCGFGFYHGFIEEALAQSGMQGLTEARTYCESLRESTRLREARAVTNAANACFHGIGHAVFDSREETRLKTATDRIFDSLDLCTSTMTDEVARTSCASGVFNALANALSSRTYGFTFSEIAVPRMCDFDDHTFMTLCYTEIAVGVVRDSFMSIEDSFAFFATLPFAPGIEAAIRGLMDDEIQRTIGERIDVDRFARYCASFDERTHRQACFEGIRTGLFKRALGTHAEDTMESLCARVPRPLYAECMGQS